MPRRGAAWITRRADSTPARWPAERGKPRAVAHRPFPSEMMATCRRGACAMAGWGTEICCTVSCCMSTVFLRRRKTVINYSSVQSTNAKKICHSALTRGANQGFHVVQVALQGPAPGGRQSILRLRQAPVERLCANDVIGFFKLAGVNTEVAVGGFKQGLELIERERAIHCQRADNSQADAFMDQAVEIRGHGFPSGVADCFQCDVALTRLVAAFLTCCGQLTHE